jgi:hypothetical protein
MLHSFENFAAGFFALSIVALHGWTLHPVCDAGKGRTIFANAKKMHCCLE